MMFCLFHRRCFFFLILFAVISFPSLVLIVTIRTAIYNAYHSSGLVEAYLRRFGLEISQNGSFVKLPFDDETSEQGDGEIIFSSNNNSKIDDETMENMFEKRRQLASEHCLHYLGLKPGLAIFPFEKFRISDPFRFIYLDDKRKILFCSVPKVASTNWRRFFIQLGTGRHQIDIPGDDLHKDASTWSFMKPLSFYKNESDAQLRRRIKGYTKIMWVRDPLQRLISAWISKLVEKNDYYQGIYSGYIIERFRRNKTAVTGHVTLEEFFSFVSHPFKKRMDVHWNFYHNHCLTCLIDYNYIGHLEGGKAEADYVIEKSTGQKDFLFPAPMNSPRQTNFYLSLLESIPFPVLKAVLHRYEIDFKMFGYL